MHVIVFHLGGFENIFDTMVSTEERLCHVCFRHFLIYLFIKFFCHLQIIHVEDICAKMLS